jgi:sugar lactone lactonase YvrE
VVYRLPVSRPTSCSFGGESLDRLYITTARQGLDATQLVAETLAGALLAIEPGVRGLAEPAFAG